VGPPRVTPGGLGPATPSRRPGAGHSVPEAERELHRLRGEPCRPHPVPSRGRDPGPERRTAGRARPFPGPPPRSQGGPRGHHRGDEDRSRAARERRTHAPGDVLGGPPTRRGLQAPRQPTPGPGAGPGALVDGGSPIRGARPPGHHRSPRGAGRGLPDGGVRAPSGRPLRVGAGPDVPPSPDERPPVAPPAHALGPRPRGESARRRRPDRAPPPRQSRRTTRPSGPPHGAGPRDPGRRGHWGTPTPSPWGSLGRHHRAARPAVVAAAGSPTTPSTAPGARCSTIPGPGHRPRGTEHDPPQKQRGHGTRTEPARPALERPHRERSSGPNTLRRTTPATADGRDEAARASRRRAQESGPDARGERPTRADAADRGRRPGRPGKGDVSSCCRPGVRSGRRCAPGPRSWRTRPGCGPCAGRAPPGPGSRSAPTAARRARSDQERAAWRA